MEGDLSLNEGKIQLAKITNGDTSEKLVIEIQIESVDQEIDCLKFKLKEGDTFEYVETLRTFDEKLMS